MDLGAICAMHAVSGYDPCPSSAELEGVAVKQNQRPVLQP